MRRFALLAGIGWVLAACAGIPIGKQTATVPVATGPDEADAAPAKAPPEVSTTPADSVARNVGSPMVDLYMSVGPHNADARGEVIASCNNEDTTTCNIYKVTWDLEAERAVQVRTVVEDPNQSTFYPNIGPTGRYLAHNVAKIRDGVAKKSMNHTVVVRDLSKWRGGEHPIVTSIPDSKWPSWRDENTLLLSRFTDRHWGDTFTASIADSQASFLIGPLTTGKGPSFGQARRNPLDPDLITSHGDDLYDGPHGHVVPHVTNLKTGEQWSFDFDGDGDGQPDFIGCAHTSWTLAGDRVICTEQGTDDFPYPGGPDYNHLRVFEKKGDHYEMIGRDPEHRGYLFKPKDPEALRAFHPRFYTEAHRAPDTNQGYCQETIFYKNAQFCGNDHTVVLTLWCIDGKNYEYHRKVVNSRIVLVDFEDWTEPKHYDVTSALEDAGLLDNAMADFANCYAPFAK